MSSPPPTVVYVITSTGVAGAERQVYDLAFTIRTRGWDVGVVSLLPMHEQFLPLRDEGVKLASLGMRKGVPNPRAIWRLARLLRDWRPDVVHAHQVHANLLARLTRPVAPIPRLISTIHSQDEGPQWRYFAYRWTDRFGDVTTAVSGLVIDEAVRRHAVEERRVRLVPNGIRLEPFERDPGLRDRTRSSLEIGHEFTWLSVGRLTAAKRHSDLLAAIRVVREAVPNVRLLIVGSGSLQAGLEHEITSTGLGPNVTLMGQRDDVGALMQAADGFVMSSAWEGLPMVLLEASASSLPIVATDVGGSQDVVKEAETGFLAPALQPERLAQAMLRMMELRPEERRSMGDRARRRVVERFDMEQVADIWEALYRES